MAQVEKPQSDRSPEKPPERKSSSELHKPDSNGISFQRQVHSKAMENCIALFLKLGATASPTTLSQKQKALIEQRLLDSFLLHQRPDHLPYAAMIITAIEKLNEKGGSSEEAISQFIRKENLELPWAHDTFVKHHLDLLLKEGSVFKTRHSLYTTDDADRVSTDSDLFIPTSDSADSASQSPTEKRKVGKGRIFQIKVETKRGRPRKMNTSRVKQESEKNEEKKPKRGRPRKMNKEKELRKKKEDVVDDGVIREANTSRVNQESEKNKENELALVPSCNQTDAENRVDIGSELQPSEEEEEEEEEEEAEAEAQEKEFDHLTGLKDTLLVNKTNSQVEETNQLQEHNLVPVREQWRVYAREGQKARTKLAGTSGGGRNKRLMN